jgi:hypothetical protein
VFKYTLAGTPLGIWTIDPANAHPTGLTIDPANISDIWIVDSGSRRVYQYTPAAGRTSGSQNASATFALAGGNTNPQDIADPPAPGTLLAPASAPVLTKLPSVADLNAAASGRPSGVAGMPSLVRREAVFGPLVGTPLARSGEPSFDLTDAGAFTRRLDSPTPVEDRAMPPAGASGERNPGDHPTPLTRRSGHGFRSERSAVGLLYRAWIDEERPASAVATDSFFAALADDAPAAE